MAGSPCKKYKAIKYRAYPDERQAVMFAKTFGCCRKVYNLMLADKIRSYRETGSFGSQTPAMYKGECPYLREVDSLALVNAQNNLEQAFRDCFDKKRLKRHGFPKFKSAKRGRRSYTTNNQKGTVAITGNGIRLPKTGVVKAKLHRLPEDGWVIKTATISCDSCGDYYISVLFEYGCATVPVTPDADRAAGLDFSVPYLYVDNNGNKGSDVKYYRSAMRKLAREQRRLSRMQGSRKGEAKSRNWHKQNIKVNRIYRHIANRRLDHLHKKSRELAETYDIIGIEDISVTDMLCSHRFRRYRRSVLDNGWSLFTVLLGYKMSDRGRYLVKLDRGFPSSQACSSCGHVNTALRDDRIRKWACPVCGAVHDRDTNAGTNIRNEAVRMVFS